MSENLKEEFKLEFDRTVEAVVKNYRKTDEIAKVIIGTIICNSLKQLQIDSTNMMFVDFYRKYIHNAPVLEFTDFTVSQLKEIIDETPMSLTDREIAYKMYIERKTYSEIAEECDILEPRTIGNNKDRIRELLKLTASRIYKN